MEQNSKRLYNQVKYVVRVFFFNAVQPIPLVAIFSRNPQIPELLTLLRQTG